MEDLAYLRALGWMVAVHSDYVLKGRLVTSWLLTHPSGRWVKGEGSTDEEALLECLGKALDVHADLDAITRNLMRGGRS
jgi:hypothetical protein